MKEGRADGNDLSPQDPCGKVKPHIASTLPLAHSYRKSAMQATLSPTSLELDLNFLLRRKEMTKACGIYHQITMMFIPHLVLLIT